MKDLLRLVLVQVEKSALHRGHGRGDQATAGAAAQDGQRGPHDGGDSQHEKEREVNTTS